MVVPTLDTRILMSECVDAVLASRLPAGVDLEVVVVDDGSRDGTAEALAGRAGVQVLRNQQPTGYSRAVNRGAAEATGDVLVFLNSDTRVEGASLGRVRDAFGAEATLGIAGAALTYPDGTPQWSGGREPGLVSLLAQASGAPAAFARLPLWRRAKPLHPPEAAAVAWVLGAAMAVRASLWRELGPFETSYRFYGQDLEFCLRAGDGGWRVRLVPGFRVVHHHGATISLKEEGMVLGNADLGRLWDDLLRWTGRRRGAAYERRARVAILLGSGLRIVFRRLVIPFVRGARRSGWRRDTASPSRARSEVVSTAR